MDTLALESLPVAVIGGGPVGLAAAAHLIARGLPVKVYEAGSGVGSNIRDWGHVRRSRRGATALCGRDRITRPSRVADAGCRCFSDRRRPGERVSGAACHHSRANGRH